MRCRHVKSGSLRTEARVRVNFGCQARIQMEYDPAPAGATANALARTRGGSTIARGLRASCIIDSDTCHCHARRVILSVRVQRAANLEPDIRIAIERDVCAILQISDLYDCVTRHRVDRDSTCERY